MGIFDSIGDWFSGGSSSEDYKEDQLNMNKEIAAQEAEERARIEREKQAYVDMFEPDDKEFIYKQFEGLTEEEMKKIAESTYNDFYNEGINSVESEYNNAISDADKDIISAEQESKDNSDTVKDNLEDDTKDFRDTAYKSGILDSSIVGSKNTQLDGLADEDLDDIIKALEADLLEANEYKKKAAQDKKSNADDLLSDYNNKVNKHVNGQSSAQDNEQKKIDSHNSSVKSEEKKFEQYKKDLAIEKSLEYDSELDKKYKEESRYGYTGDRKAHYDKRVATAKAFYDKYDKKDVLDMIKSNPQLPELLGYEYSKFIDSYRNA